MEKQRLQLLLVQVLQLKYIKWQPLKRMLLQRLPLLVQVKKERQHLKLLLLQRLPLLVIQRKLQQQKEDIL